MTRVIWSGRGSVCGKTGVLVVWTGSVLTGSSASMAVISWFCSNGWRVGVIARSRYAGLKLTSRDRRVNVRWVYPRRRHSAALSSDPLGFVIVTHPFHPLNGQRLEILYAKRRGADMVFVCAGGFSGQMTLPQAWTDRGEPPGTGRLSAEGLAALGAATRALQGR